MSESANSPAAPVTTVQAHPNAVPTSGTPAGAPAHGAFQQGYARASPPTTVQADPSAVPSPSVAPPAPPAPPAAPPATPPAAPASTQVQIDPQTRAALQRDAALVAREQALKTQQGEIERLRQLEAQLRDDPIGIAEKMGATPEKWLDRFAGTQPAKGEVPPEVAQLRTELQQLQQERRQEQTAAEKRAQQAKYQEIKQGYMGRIQETIAGTPEFAPLGIAELAPAVYNLIENHAAHTQSVYGVADELKIEDACKQVASMVIPRMQQQIVALADAPEFHDALRNAVARINRAPAASQGNPPVSSPVPSALPPVGPPPGSAAPDASRMSRDESLNYAASLINFFDE